MKWGGIPGAGVLAALGLLAGCPTRTDGPGNENGATNENSPGFDANLNGDANQNGDSENLNENGQPAGTEFRGVWIGTLGCDETQQIGDTPPPEPNPTQRPISVTFDELGRPRMVTVLAYSPVPDQSINVGEPGDVVVAAFTIPGLPDRNGNPGPPRGTGTLQTTIVSADYASRRLELLLEVSIEEVYTFGAVSTATGRQRIVIEPSAAQLIYSSSVQYQVTITAGSVSIDATSSTECSGLMSAQ